MTFLQALFFAFVLCFIYCSANDTTTALPSNLQVSTTVPMNLNEQNPHSIEPRVVQKRSNSIECTGEGCKPKQKSPKRVSKRSTSSSSSEEKRRNKKKKCKHCEGRKRRMTTFETETENQQTRLKGHITNNPSAKNEEVISEVPKSRFERSASKSNNKSEEDDEEYSDEDKEEDDEDDEDLYSDEKPKKKKKVVKRPPPKTTKLQDLFTHFNG